MAHQLDADIRDLFTVEELERLEHVRRRHCPTAHDRLEDHCLLFVFGICILVWAWALAQIAMDLAGRIGPLLAGL